MQLGGRKIEITLNAQPSDLDFGHLIKRHIPQLPAVPHRNRPEADAFLGVILQKVSGIGSHREEVARIGRAVSDKLFLGGIELRQPSGEGFRHQIISLACLFLLRLLLSLALLLG